MNWLLFLAQLPATPSSLRVNVWRRLKAAGALGPQNGVWILPNRPDQQEFLQELLSYIQEQNASGQVFVIDALNNAVEKDILDRFRTDRDAEYAEFLDKSVNLNIELQEDMANQKFTFAELEDLEEDFNRLAAWLAKIRERDFLGDGRGSEAADIHEVNSQVIKDFSRKVYSRAGFDSIEPGE